MYLKSDKELFGRRRTFRWALWLVLLLILVGAGYFGYQQLGGRYDELFVAGGTPTPMPTPTPSAAFYVAEAEQAYLEGSTGRAIAAYQQALDLEPNQTEIYLELARLLTYGGNPERGLEMARQALIRQPGNARAWALLCLAYDWLGLVDQAISFCRTAVDLDPALPEAYAYLAEAYIDNGQWPEANTTIATARELDENNVDVLRNQAYVLENQGNYYGAIEGYRGALEIEDKLVHLYLGIGRNASALGDLVRARGAYEDAVEIEPENAQALARLGWTQILLGDYDSAKPNLLAAVEYAPYVPEAYHYLGTLYFHQRNYEDAIEMYRPAVQYGEARSRRRVVLFVITEETANEVGAVPEGPEVAYAQFVHPIDFVVPLRGEFKTVEGGPAVTGQIRLDVMSGRYELSIDGLSPAPSGKVYVGWFRQLYWPEGNLMHTDPIFPSPDGTASVSGTTGAVKGPPIETYYLYALSYYLLDDCDSAMPLIEIALRIDPDEENARRTLELCR